jgi:hypothetical protein
MAKLIKSAVLACTTQLEAKALAVESPTSTDSAGAIRCVNCERCPACIDCEDCVDCTGCRDCARCEGCSDCSSLEDSFDSQRCVGTDTERATMLRGCADCSFISRSMFVAFERGTAEKPIANRFGNLQLTAAEFDQMWALPEGTPPPDPVVITKT